MDPFRFAPPAQVIGRQRKFVRFFSDMGARRVLDVGCGRGLFLQLLRDSGIEETGIDISETLVQQCRQAGFHVEQGDALVVLRQFQAGGKRFDGIFCSHVIEHLEGERPAELIGLCAAVLAPRGRLVLITPNVENLQVLTEGFWLDLSHRRFIPRILAETLMGDAGLRVISSETDPDTQGRWDAAPWWRKTMWRLAFGRVFLSRYLLSGLDAYVVGERSAGSDR